MRTSGTRPLLVVCSHEIRGGLGLSKVPAGSWLGLLQDPDAAQRAQWLEFSPKHLRVPQYSRRTHSNLGHGAGRDVDEGSAPAYILQLARSYPSRVKASSEPRATSTLLQAQASCHLSDSVHIMATDRLVFTNLHTHGTTEYR